MKAKIDNKILKVKVIDPNYNDHAKEVQILEGIHKGRLSIIENNDMIIDTYKDLIELCKADITNLKDLEEHHISELISTSTSNTIKQFSFKYRLTKKEYYKLLNNCSYENCTTIQDMTEYILIDSLEYSVNNIKSSFTSVKNKALNEVQ